MADGNPGAALEKAIKDRVRSTIEFDENVKSPLIFMGCSSGVFAAATAIMWPIDVVKNHILAGKSGKVSIQNQWSFRGLRFGLAGASIAGMDISHLYIKEFGREFSTTKKALITLAPLSLVPVLSVLELLKVNSQIHQQDMRSCFQRVTKTVGMRGLLRGMLPYTGIYGLSFGMIIGPALYLQKDNEKTVHAGFLLGSTLSFLLLTTTLDIIKTQSMLGNTTTFSRSNPIKSLNISRQHFFAAFTSRTIYMIVFGIFTGKFIDITTQIAHEYKSHKYLTAKKAGMFAKDEEYDSLMPLVTDDMEQDAIIRRVYMRDG